MLEHLIRDLLKGLGIRYELQVFRSATSLRPVIRIESPDLRTIEDAVDAAWEQNR